MKLSKQDIDHIARTVETEVPRSIRARDPVTYDRMVGAVVDTITNRLSTGRYGNSIQAVVNQPRAFSKINGPSKINPYGSVQNAPRASDVTQRTVNQHLAQRAMGKPSEIGGALDYANPYHSDKSNLTGWINPMRAAGAVGLGVGTSIHYHGLAPHNIGRAAPDYTVQVPDDIGRMAIGPQSPSYRGLPENLLPSQPRNVPVPTPAPRGLLSDPASMRVAQAFDATAPARVPGPQRVSPVAPTRVQSQEYDLPPTPTFRSSVPGRPGVPTPTFASLPPGVMGRIAPNQPTMAAAANVPVPTSAPRGLLGSIGSAIGGLFGATPANAAAANANPMQPIGAPAPTPRDSRFAQPDVDINRRVDAAFGTANRPQPAWATGPQNVPVPTTAPRPSDLISPTAAKDRRVAPTPVQPVAPTRVASQDYALPPTPTPAPRPTVAGPVGQSVGPQAQPQDAWGGLRSPTVAPVSPNVGFAQPATQPGMFGSAYAGPVAGAMLGGLLGGPAGAVAGGLLGSPAVRSAVGLGGLSTAPGGARGDGFTTGLITGQPIPNSVRQHFAANGLDASQGFTGLGLPSVPNKPSQSKSKSSYGTGGGKGPSMSKSASDAIGRMGAGVGGLW